MSAKRTAKPTKPSVPTALPLFVFHRTGLHLQQDPGDVTELIGYERVDVLAVTPNWATPHKGTTKGWAIRQLYLCRVHDTDGTNHIVHFSEDDLWADEDAGYLTTYSPTAAAPKTRARGPASPGWPQTP